MRSFWSAEADTGANGLRRKGTRTFGISNRTLNKDLNEKSEIYARNGIPEYWVIYLVNKKLIVHTEPEGNSYR